MVKCSMLFTASENAHTSINDGWPLVLIERCNVKLRPDGSLYHFLCREGPHQKGKMQKSGCLSGEWCKKAGNGVRSNAHA